MKKRLLLVALLTAGPASAAVYDLHYTTLADSLFPAVTVDARLTTDDGEFYGAPGYLVTGITGTRGGAAITGLSDPFSEIFFPGPPFLDDFGISYAVGNVTYNLYRSNASFYNEFALAAGADTGEGRLVFDRDFSLTPAAAVPEPQAWALMIAGFGLVGAALRRRRPLTMRPVPAPAG